MTAPTRDRLFWLLLALAVLTAGNAVWMLLDPLRWYHDLPAGVPDTGPFNAHFVRDMGCAFATIALALFWATFRPRWRPPLLVIAAFFLVAHAALHVFDTSTGALASHHWLLDFPGVYLPALVSIPIALHALRHADAPH